MRSVGCLLALVAATAGLPGQRDAEPPVARAERLAKDLELPHKRGDAMLGLWQLGADAAPVLARTLRDPRPDIVRSACAVICEIGRPAAQLREHIERALPRAKGERKAALQWALHGITNERVALANWNGSVVVLDDKGDVVAEHPNIDQVWGVQMLPDGHFLVAQLTLGVHEFDDAGKKVWSYGGAPRQALRAQRLLDGTTVIIDGQQKIREIDETGEETWSFAGRLSCATRLLNGHYVAVDCKANKFIEIDRKGATVISWDVPAHCYGVRRLPSGNTLLTTRTNDRVIEYDPKGQVVRERSLACSPNDVMLRHDGVLLVADFNGVIALDAGDKKLWRYKGQMIGGLGR